MSRPAVHTLGFLVLLALAGCDSASFVPPPPAELGPAAKSTPPAKTVEMIVSTAETPDRSNWLITGRVEAGVERVIFRSSKTGSSESSTSEAAAIRSAPAGGASALIVEPGDSPDVADALAEVHAQGIPIVLIARPVAGRQTPYPLVTLAPFADSAKAVVTAALEDAKAAKLPAGGSALILIGRLSDAFSDPCTNALKVALGEAGVASIALVEFDGSEEDAKAVLEKYLESHPKVALVFGEESEAVSAGVAVRVRLGDKRRLIVAGYVGDGASLGRNTAAQSAAIADRGARALARRALRTVVQLADGKTVPPRIELPITVTRHSSAFPAPSPRGPNPDRD